MNDANEPTDLPFNAAELRQFTGSERFFRHMFGRICLYTE